MGSPSKRFLVIPAKLPSNNNNAEQGEVARENHYSNNDSNNLRGILKRARCLSESQAEYLSLVSSSVIDSGSSMSSTTIIEEDIVDQNAGKSTAASSAESKKICTIQRGCTTTSLPAKFVHFGPKN